MDSTNITYLLKMIDNWRSLKSKTCTDLSSLPLLKKYEESCPHDIIAYLSTRYYDDGLMDPDYYSSYRCLQCGADISEKCMHKYNGLEFKMHGYSPEKYYSDEEKFMILEMYLRNLAEINPELKIDEAINLVNEKFK